MAYSLIGSVEGVPGVSGGGDTASLDTTGADLLIVAIAAYEGGGSTPTDNKGNTFVPLTSYGYPVTTRIFYCASPNVGSGHVVTYNEVGSYPWIGFAAFSGSHATPADQENGNASSMTPGSVTPTEDNELIIGAVCGYTGTPSGPSGFTVMQSEAYLGASNMGGGFAYKIQTTAGAENPAWTGFATAFSSAVATFKAAGGGGGGAIPHHVFGKVLTGCLGGAV